MDKRYYLDSLLSRYPQLDYCSKDINEAFECIKKSFENGHKLLIAGNGGSAADSEHAVGELMKSFVLPRKLKKTQYEALKAVDEEMGSFIAENLQGALPAISLTGQSSLQTAFINDVVPELIFAQQVNGYGNSGDVFWGISTSGNSKNVIYAAINAKAKGLKVIGLTGKRESKLMKYSDICIRVPETETYKIQELHLPVYHCLCLMLEDYFFGE